MPPSRASRAARSRSIHRLSVTQGLLSAGNGRGEAPSGPLLSRMPRSGVPMTASRNPTQGRRIQRVEMLNIVKRFPGVLANSRVCFDVQAGEVHALLGENGAGKSTLMRQLYGLYQPDEGEILIDGQPVVFRSPADAIRAGIGMIHQHFMLVPSLTVVENVALGLKSSRGLILDLDRVAARIKRLAQEYHLKVDPG